MRTLQLTLQLDSGKSNYELCEMVEQILLNSVLNNCEYKLNVTEVKVTKEERTMNEKVEK